MNRRFDGIWSDGGAGHAASEARPRKLKIAPLDLGGGAGRAASEARRKLITRRFEAISMGGGAGRNRTDDLYNAIVALSQLSYGP